MSEAKHTPEPWEYVEEPLAAFSMVTGREFIVAGIPNAEDDIEETRANACLITTAPKMLQILKDTRDFLEMEGFEKCATSAIDSVIAQATNKKE